VSPVSSEASPVSTVNICGSGDMGAPPLCAQLELAPEFCVNSVLGRRAHARASALWSGAQSAWGPASPAPVSAADESRTLRRRAHEHDRDGNSRAGAQVIRRTASALRASLHTPLPLMSHVPCRILSRNPMHVHTVPTARILAAARGAGSDPLIPSRCGGRRAAYCIILSLKIMSVGSFNLGSRIPALGLYPSVALSCIGAAFGLYLGSSADVIGS